MRRIIERDATRRRMKIPFDNTNNQLSNFIEPFVAPTETHIVVIITLSNLTERIFFKLHRATSPYLKSGT